MDKQGLLSPPQRSILNTHGGWEHKGTFEDEMCAVFFEETNLLRQQCIIYLNYWHPPNHCTFLEIVAPFKPLLIFEEPTRVLVPLWD